MHALYLIYNTLSHSKYHFIQNLKYNIDFSFFIFLFFIFYFSLTAIAPITYYTYM